MHPVKTFEKMRMDFKSLETDTHEGTKNNSFSQKVLSLCHKNSHILFHLCDQSIAPIPLCHETIALEAFWIFSCVEVSQPKV